MDMDQVDKNEIEVVDIDMESEGEAEGVLRKDPLDISSPSASTAPRVNGNSEPSTQKTNGGGHGSNASTPSTPKTPATGGTPGVSSETKKKRKRLSVAEREQIEREREAKRIKLEEEKAEKARKRDEEKRARDEKKAQEAEEKRQKELAREREKQEKRKKDEEEKKKKEEVRKAKEEEKKQKDEEKRVKDEEKRKKDEEKKKKEDEKKRKKEEEEAKKKKEEDLKSKQSAALFNFIKIKSPSTPTGSAKGKRITPIKLAPKCLAGSSKGSPFDQEASPAPPSEQDDSSMELDSSISHRYFMPFEIKPHQALSPLCRRPFTSFEMSKLDAWLGYKGPDEELNVLRPAEDYENYLKSIKGGRKRRSGRTEVLIDREVEVLPMEEEKMYMEDYKERGLVKYRMKLLQFDENRRPPYWGTYKAGTRMVSGKNPWKRDENMDYDVDSDEEWEDEPDDGEDLGDSDKEDKDEAGADGEEDEDDEGWLVPHGYLSDDEGEREDKPADKEELRTQEFAYFQEEKKKVKLALPIIDTNPEDFKDLMPRIIYNRWREVKPRPPSRRDTPEVVTVS